jgi:hypothetical protein
VTVLELMKATEIVRFNRLQDGKLYYECIRKSMMTIPTATDVSMSLTDGFSDSVWGIEVLYSFPIPLHDTAGAVFPAWDDKPLFYMRWIRKEMERRQVEAAEIAKAKEDWEREQASQE